VVEQGLISHFVDPLCFPEWEPGTNRLTYRLYRRRNQEHITPIERIPESVPNGRSGRRDNPKTKRLGEHLRRRYAARRQGFSVTDAPAAARRAWTVMRS
jgi:hypothetical protein